MNNFWLEKNVLVTGGTGFVGSHLVEELVSRKANVITTFLRQNHRAYFWKKKLHEKTIIVNLDITDFHRLFDIVTKFQIDYIFHLAAQPLVDVAYYNPRRTFESNVQGTVNVLESARLYKNIKGVIVSSSDKSYGKLSKKQYKETDPLKGDHPYEVSKAATDLVAYSYFKTYGTPVITARFGNIYGEGDLNFSRIIPGVLKSIVAKQTFEIRSNGKYVRDYLYVKDVVDGYLLMAKHIDDAKGEAFNFGSTDSLSVINVVKLVEKQLKKKVDYKILNIAKNEIPYQSLNYAKAKLKLGWKPKTTMKKIIPQIYHYYQESL